MPPLAAAAAALGTAIAGPALGAAFGNFILSISIPKLIGSIALSFVTSAVFGKPKAAKLPTDAGISSVARGRTQVVRSSVQPARLIYGQVKVSGVLAFVESTGSSKEFLHLVVMLGLGPIEEIGDVWLNEDVIAAADLDGDGNVTTGKYAGYVRIKKHLGATDQDADAALIDEVDAWTAAHRLRGIAYLYIRLKHDREKFPSGIPNPAALCKGRLLFDPRDDSTAWSANPALVVRDFLTVAEGLNIDEARIDDDLVAAAANVCDEEVALAAGGALLRYHCNGTVELDGKPGDALEDLLTSMAGLMVWSAGQYKLYAGAAGSKEDDIDASWLRGGDITVRPSLPRRELFNAVRAQFVDPDRSWQPTDAPPVTNATYETQDGGERFWRDIELPFTTDAAVAQRLAKLHLEHSRQGMTVELHCNLKALEVSVWDIYGLTFPHLGFDGKLFRVTDWTFTADLGVDLTLQEYAAAVYTWSAEETDHDLAPNTNLPAVSAVRPVTNLHFASGNDELFVDTDGTVFGRLHVMWNLPADAFVSGIEVSVQKEGDAAPNVTTLGRQATDFWVAPAKSGDVYTVAVTAWNLLGIPAAAVSGMHQVEGKSALPPDMGTFLVSQDPDGTRRYTGAYPGKPLDFAGYRIRYTQTPPLDWDSDPDLADDGGLIGVLPYESNKLAAGAYTFGIKPVDTSGNEAVNAKLAVVTLGDPRIRSALYLQDEYTAGFPGTRTDCFRNYEGILEADGDTGSTWDDFNATTWDSLASTPWYAFGPRVSPIAYEPEVIDLGADVSFTPLITVDGNGTPTVEMKTGTDADGDVTGSYGAIGQVSGKRYAQFKVSMADSAPTIANVRVLLDGERIADAFEDVDTSSETAPWFESIAAGHFRIATRKADMALISQARIDALQSVGPGFSWEVVDKAATVSGNPNPAAEFKVYNGSGTLTDATVDVTLTGPKEAS